MMLKGVHRLEFDPIMDERGFFARSWCCQEFERQTGLKSPTWVQQNISFNKKKGTLRGMHYQCAPHEEAKLVSCTRGSIYDVILDLRPDSPTYCQWESLELSEENRYTVYLPKGVAHGFQTLTDYTTVFYQMSEYYHPGAGRGVRWDDPAFQIQWPLPVRSISQKDQTYPDFQTKEFSLER